MALDAVELTSYYFPRDLTADYLNRLKLRVHVGPRHFRDCSGQQFLPAARAEARRKIANVQRWIDHAASLDAPVIRIFAGNVPRGSSEDQAVSWAIEESKPSCRTPPSRELRSLWRIMEESLAQSSRS